ncbi:MAG: 3-dehydroquinate synthase [Candidatus Cloacimonetes bacterium]|nr:3-dehydroquinate synthase [Candidatus Cloacimonadota bacterium]
MPYTQISPDNLELQVNLEYPSQGIIVCDAELYSFHADFFGTGPLPLIKLEAAEANKNLDTVNSLYCFFCDQELKRGDIVHVFGGGIVCDIAAFAASTYKRGCHLHLYPSTLLAMVDAAIGGKTGVNFRSFKNHIGSFYPAERVIIHPNFLKSLPSEELRQGYAEMLKGHLLWNELPLPDFDGQLPTVEDILSHALYKISICRKDPFDVDTRRLLNFGHSFAHALEGLSDFAIKHGDAVALGMNMACDLSLELDLIDKARYTDLKNTLGLYPYPAAALDFATKQSLEDILPWLRQDKKNSDELGLILPVGDQIKAVEISLSQLRHWSSKRIN